MKLTVIDTPGFGDQITMENTQGDVVYSKQKLSLRLVFRMK